MSTTESPKEPDIPYLETKANSSAYYTRRRFLGWLAVSAGLTVVGSSLSINALSNITENKSEDLKNADPSNTKENTTISGSDMFADGLSRASKLGIGLNLAFLGGWMAKTVIMRRHLLKFRDVYSDTEPVDYVAHKTHFSLSDRKQFDEKVKLLPPSGGKIISLGKKDLWYRLPPTTTSEEQVAIVNGLQRQGDIDDIYVHQLSVQGRLKDPFKYVALALLLDSPYPNDWNTPLYKADWGKVAPLIHDGGKTLYVNELWKNPGRTDFLQRVSINRSIDYQKILALNPDERREIPKSELLAALNQKLEYERLFIESRFYQRIGLARHCVESSAPLAISVLDRDLLVSEWEKFETRMRDVVNNMELFEFHITPWFNNHSRPLWKHVNDRYEADWEPIREILMDVEEAKVKNPKIHPQIRQLLIDTTNSIDQIVFHQ